MFSCALFNASTAHSMAVNGDVFDQISIPLSSINDKTVEMLINTTGTLLKVKDDFASADNMCGKAEVVISVADELAPEVIDKIDGAIDKTSNIKDVQKASEVLDLVGEVAEQLGAQNDNATLEHLGGVVGNTSDLLKANNAKEVAKEVIEISEDINGLIKENKGFFKRLFSCCGSKKKK